MTQRNMLVGVAACLLLGCAGAATPGAPSSPTPTPADCAPAAKAAGDLQRTGLVAEITPEMNEALINTSAWDDLGLKKREAVARALATHCACVRGRSTRWVRLRDSRSGVQIAEFDSTGFSQP